MKRIALFAFCIFLGLWAAACGPQSVSNFTTCHITIEPTANQSRFDRFRAIADLVSALELTRRTGDDTHVYTSISAQDFLKADTFVNTLCADLGPDITALNAEIDQADVEDGISFEMNGNRFRLSQIGEEELGEARETIFDLWHQEPLAECMVRATVVVDHPDGVAMSEREILAGHDVLSDMIAHNLQYGIAYTDYVIHQNVLVISLRSNCAEREEVVEFFGRYWLSEVLGREADGQTPEFTITVESDGLTLDDLVYLGR